MKMNFTLSSNVLKEIHNYTNKKDEKACPTFVLKVTDVEKIEDRYWLTLEEESGKKIWAVLSLLLTQQTLVQQLITEPIIQLRQYSLHKFEATNFVDNPLGTYRYVIEISDMQILERKALRKEMQIQNNTEKPKVLPRRKRTKRRPEPELESSKDDLQPSENNSPNIKPTNIQPEEGEGIIRKNIIPKSFVGNGKTATLISSLRLTKNSPFIRTSIKICDAISVSAKGCTYRRCHLEDSSGEISCVIVEPLCTSTNNLLKVGTIIEIENAMVEEVTTKKLLGLEKYELFINQSTIVALYNNTCVYENPPKPCSGILPIKDRSKIKYSSLEKVKNSLESAGRADAIGVVVWMSRILDVNYDNKLVKCRNLRIQDESGSVLVSMWGIAAEANYFPIGSIVSVKLARMKMFFSDLELIVDGTASILLAEDCEEKTRLQDWYKLAVYSISLCT